MVNAFKGEVLIVDGEKQYKFVFGMYAQVVLEEFTKESWTQFWGRAREWTATDVLALFCAGLARYHEEMSTNRRAVADLMDNLGPTRCSEIVNEAVTRATPPAPAMPPDHKEDANGAARPMTEPNTAQATTT